MNTMDVLRFQNIILGSMIMFIVLGLIFCFVTGAEYWLAGAIAFTLENIVLLVIKIYLKVTN